MSSKKNTYTIHDTPKKNRLIGAILGGKSVAEASAMFGIPAPTAYTIRRKYLETGSTSNKSKSGRPSKVNDRGKRAILRTAIKSRRMPLNEVANVLGLDISPSTMRNVLGEAGYHWRVAKKVPYLTKAHKMAKKYWAKKYRGWGMKQWGKVSFTDECYVYLGDGRGRIYVTRRPGEELKEDCVVPSFKQSSVRVMVWGAIMLGQKGPLIVLEYPGGKGSGMNSQRYQEQVLNGVFVDFHARMRAAKGEIIFQQDNASSHTSKSTKNWFATRGISLLYHPPSSPDLNPIEPVWHELKKRLRALPHPPNTLQQLKSAVLQIWEELPIEDIDKHIRRMPDRVEAVLAAKGGHTKF